MFIVSGIMFRRGITGVKRQRYYLAVPGQLQMLLLLCSGVQTHLNFSGPLCLIHCSFCADFWSRNLLWIFNGCNELLNSLIVDGTRGELLSGTRCFKSVWREWLFLWCFSSDGFLRALRRSNQVLYSGMLKFNHCLKRSYCLLCSWILCSKHGLTLSYMVVGVWKTVCIHLTDLIQDSSMTTWNDTQELSKKEDI